MNWNMKKISSSNCGFTLVELLVVIAMIMLLMGSVTSAVMSAQRRAKIVQATTAVKEMTNAILAYENYTKEGDLSSVKIQKWTAADEKNLSFLLGKEKTKTGETIPVLYNASLKGSFFVDPWGTAYEVQIKEGSIQIDNDGVLQGAQKTAVAFPNFYRRQMEEK